MLQKRVVVCLDVKDGRVTKGIKFQDNADIGDPVALARYYYEQGADELVFYDITASLERRNLILSVVEQVAQVIFIPFAVGGGIKSVDDMRQVIWAGAEKVSVNSQAVRNPSIIAEGAALFGSQCLVVGMDVLADQTMPCGYRVVINGGRLPTDWDALAWALRVQELGAGEIVLNSIDADGTKEGYDQTVTSLISQNLSIPVVASGGAGSPEHLRQVLTNGRADAALIASMVHYGSWTIGQIKDYLTNRQVPVRRIQSI